MAAEMTTKPDTSMPREGYTYKYNLYPTIEEAIEWDECPAESVAHVIEYSAYAKAIEALKKIEEQDRMIYAKIAGDCLDELGEL